MTNLHTNQHTRSTFFKRHQWQESSDYVGYKSISRIARKWTVASSNLPAKNSMRLGTTIILLGIPLSSVATSGISKSACWHRRSSSTSNYELKHTTAWWGSHCQYPAQAHTRPRAFVRCRPHTHTSLHTNIFEKRSWQHQQSYFLEQSTCSTFDLIWAHLHQQYGNVRGVMMLSRTKC